MDVMRVLHLLHSLRRGGLERVVVSVANGLSRRGLEQGVCCLHEAGPLIECLDADVETFVLESRPNAMTLPLRLMRVYRAFGPDVIHTVDFCSWPDATLAAMSRPRVRRMHTFHGFLSRPPWRYRLTGRILAGRTQGLCAVSEDLAADLQVHVKQVTAPYKYPRIIEFVDELPKTVSGKIRRVELRKMEEERKAAQ